MLYREERGLERERKGGDGDSNSKHQFHFTEDVNLNETDREKRGEFGNAKTQRGYSWGIEHRQCRSRGL